MQAGMIPDDIQPALSRQEYWRFEYTCRPYLREASDAALAQRLKGVMNNMSTLTSEGKIGLLPIGPDGERWMKLFTHVLEEYGSRGGLPPIDLSDMPFPNPTAPDLPKAVEALKAIQIPKPGQALVKLGKREYMRELYEKGRIRIAPASSYSDPSLNHAIKDDAARQCPSVEPASAQCHPVRRRAGLQVAGLTAAIRQVAHHLHPDESLGQEWGARPGLCSPATRTTPAHPARGGVAELQFDRITPGSEFTITVFDQKTGKPKGNIKPTSEITSRSALDTNYYVYCMTHSLDYRLFDDFEADACVIIRDPAAFKIRLQEAVRGQLPNWVDWDDLVTYIDPYLHPKGGIDLFFSKHFRFWYQHEYRFSWIPQSETRNHLEPFFVELGSLEQISEIAFM